MLALVNVLAGNVSLPPPPRYSVIKKYLLHYIASKSVLLTLHSVFETLSVLL